MNMVKNPLVSVLIPVYNQRPDFLRQTIDSVIDQTYANIEIVISDNHSTNGVREVLDTYSDNRIRIISPPEHLPLTPHFQWASEQLRGEYISFLPSDDWLEKECIEEQVKLIHPHQNIVMSFCNVKQFYNGIKADFINLKPGISPSEEEIQAYVKMSKLKGFIIGCLFRRSVYNKTGGIGHGQLSYISDRWLFIQMAMHGDGAYTNKSLSVFRNENPLRISRTVIASEDTVKIFQMIEQNYLPKIRGGQRTIDKEKNKIVYGFLKSMPRDLRTGHMSKEEFEKTLENMKKLGRSRLILFLIRLYDKKRFMGPLSALFYLSTKFNNALVKIKNTARIK